MLCETPWWALGSAAHPRGALDAPVGSLHEKGSKAQGYRRCFDNVGTTVGWEERGAGWLCLELSPVEAAYCSFSERQVPGCPAPALLPSTGFDEVPRGCQMTSSFTSP